MSPRTGGITSLWLLDFAEERFSDAIKTLERGASAINPKKGDGAARLYGLLADLYAERGSAAQRVLADSL